MPEKDGVLARERSPRKAGCWAGATIPQLSTLAALAEDLVWVPPPIWWLKKSLSSKAKTERNAEEYILLTCQWKQDQESKVLPRPREQPRTAGALCLPHADIKPEALLFWKNQEKAHW